MFVNAMCQNRNNHNNHHLHRPLPTSPVITTTSAPSPRTTMHPCCLTAGKLLGGLGLGLVMLTVVYSWMTRTWNLVLTLMVIGAQVMCVVGFILYRLGYPSVPNDRNAGTTENGSSGGGGLRSQHGADTRLLTDNQGVMLSAPDRTVCIGMPDAPPSYDTVMSNDHMYPKTTPGMIGAIPTPPPTPPPVYSDTMHPL